MNNNIVKFDKPESCNKCKGKNLFFNHILNENQTICSECWFIDYWAYGYFECGSYMN